MMLRTVFCYILVGTGLVFPGCAIAQAPFQQQSIREFLDANGWISLSIPDSKMAPGAVIKVTQKNDAVPLSYDVRWLGDFRNCGVTDKDLGLVRGKYPAVGIGKDLAVKASLVANLIAKFGGSAEVEKANNAVLRIEDAGGDAIDLLAFSLWFAQPGNPQKMPAACAAFLAQPDIYIVSEAFRISKGSYSIVDKNGAKLGISVPVPSQTIEAGLSGSIGSSGELIVAGDLYFGVRRVKQLAPGSFATLGADPQSVPEADNMLRTTEE